MKAFRDNRRLFDSLIVAGGQVNIGERQVNIEQEGTRPVARAIRHRHGARVIRARPRKDPFPLPN
jgi:hypothetical protein